MVCTFYTNHSGSNVMNKSLTELASTNLVIKNDYNKNDFSLIVTDFHNANYVRLGTNFYFIQNVIRLTNGNYELQLHLDLLETFKNDLLSKNFRIVRSSNIYNRYIIDNEQSLSSKQQLQTLLFKGNMEITNQLSNANCYVITVNNTININESEV